MTEKTLRNDRKRFTPTLIPPLKGEEMSGLIHPQWGVK